MPKAEEPDAHELREIGRRLCALVDTKPEEPVDATALRLVMDEQVRAMPEEAQRVRFALGICADALAALELPLEVQNLRALLDEYVEHRAKTDDLRCRLAKAIEAAVPILDDEAAARADALEWEGVLTEEELAQGFELRLWPSPESLRQFPLALVDAMAREDYATAWLQKILHDLARLEASPEIHTNHVPTKTRLAKALKHAGYDVAEIARVTEPNARQGEERARARNAVTRRLQSKSEDLVISLLPLAKDGQSENPLTSAQREESARFVAGVGRDVRAIFGASRERDPEKSE
jgi:hypothetical protein